MELNNKSEILDKIREASNEFDDGVFDRFVETNYFDLIKSFCDNNVEFDEYCKEVFNEQK